MNYAVKHFLQNAAKNISKELFFIIITPWRYTVNMINLKFAENLKLLMQETNVNQVMLANEIKISQSAISAWLLNKKEPSITSLWLLADFFNCTVDELIGRSNF